MINVVNKRMQSQDSLYKITFEQDEKDFAAKFKYRWIIGALILS
jgi:hypothetical protein